MDTPPCPGAQVPPREAAVKPRGWSFLGQAEPSTPLLPTLTPSRAGEVLDERFELIQQIGKGGMCVVYLARDRQLPQPVAVKILGARDPALEQRFLDEVEILGTVSHPNLVRPLGKGRTAGGQLYMAMEYVRGENLSERLGEIGPLSWRDSVAVGIQVGEVLAALHAAGVLHRDIKPSNIMLCSRSEVVIKLIDLGVAKKQTDLWAAESASRRFSTDVGVAVGTPPYLPPEAGLVPPDPRFDVYGLAATIYELCTAKSPERGPYRPLRGDAPPELDAVLAAALHGDADARTATIEALLVGLRRVRDEGEHGPLFDGRYEILRPLGAGAKAEVVLAHHRKARRDLALKILHPTMKSDEERTRLRREARVLSLLRHPAFPTLHDIHEVDGHVYLALEFVAGERASKFILNPLRPAHVIAVGIQLARALLALSELGVVHRDINNSNVLIDFECGPDLVMRPVVKLIDLGMCELLPAFYARVHRYGTPPENRVVLGTGGLEQFAWTAPEAVRDREWSEKSDVWSVALLLFQLLTGHRPFRGGSSDPPVSPCEWVPACSSELEYALLAALNPDPALRSNAEQLLEQLTDAAEVQAAEDEDDDEHEHEHAIALPRVGPASPSPTALPPGRMPAAATPQARSEPAESAVSLAGAASNVLAASAPRPAGATPLAQLEPSAAGSTVAPARTPAATASRPELIAGPASGAASPVAGSWRSIALAVLGTLLVAVVVVSALLPAAPQEPLADRTLAPAAVTPPADLGPAPGPTIAPVNLVAQRVRPPLRPDDEPIQADMGATLDRVSEPLHACAREAGRRVTVELSVEADATRFAAINVLPAEPAQDRCVRAVLEPLRFVAEPSASTFIIRYQP